MKKGFTLIELITVVIIIAIMAALALPQYTRFMERGHGSTAKNALNMIRKAEATYFALNSAYTNDTTGTTGLAQEVPEIAKLFGRSGWTAVEVEQRKKLQKSPLAQWLHGFYSSHRNSEYCYSVKKIRMLCGSTTDDLYGFKRDVKKALQKVEDVTGWECCVLQDDLIQVVKPRRESPMIPTER